MGSHRAPDATSLCAEHKPFCDWHFGRLPRYHQTVPPYLHSAPLAHAPSISDWTHVAEHAICAQLMQIKCHDAINYVNKNTHAMYNSVIGASACCCGVRHAQFHRCSAPKAEKSRRRDIDKNNEYRSHRLCVIIQAGRWRAVDAERAKSSNDNGSQIQLR